MPVVLSGWVIHGRDLVAWAHKKNISRVPPGENWPPAQKLRAAVARTQRMMFEHAQLYYVDLVFLAARGGHDDDHDYMFVTNSSTVQGFGTPMIPRQPQESEQELAIKQILLDASLPISSYSIQVVDSKR
ncbi:hypothetical protein EIP91_011203 [Steccherinum ochraceum]|uniref:Uncharacterized protein n=1 Tax=Steccherinum ochraceum TaxID=92696 RepID=A0A4R0QZX9_9APHY|nr:hypothetical protein EIP91_011203 [Steccherinum ochraceum]